MILPPPSTTLTDTLFPYATLYRSEAGHSLGRSWSGPGDRHRRENGRAADGGLYKCRSAGPDDRDRRGALLVAIQRRSLAQGRNVRQRPEAGRTACRLRSGCDLDEGGIEIGRASSRDRVWQNV